MNFTHGYADNDGLRMYFEVHGRPVPGQRPLLLIPGGGSTIGTNFGELIPVLADKRQVIAVEEEGHGHTRPTGRPSRPRTLPATSSRFWTSSAWRRLM